MKVLATILSIFLLGGPALANTSYPGKIIKPVLAKSLGGDRGNGAEDIAFNEGSAWFVEMQTPRTINVCYKIASAFPLGIPAIEQAITQSFEKWRNYIQTKNPHHLESVQLTTNYKILPACDGSEDLTFKFGIMDTQVTQAIAQYSQAISFSSRTQFDAATGWSKGFIWVAPQGSLGKTDDAPTLDLPDWTLSYALAGILTHELGHVFGCEHTRGTIMAADIARYLHYPWEWQRVQGFTKIDFKRELLLCELCDYEQSGLLGALGYPPYPVGQQPVLQNRRTEYFKRLSGRDAVGTINSSFSIRSKKYQLHISDDKGFYDLDMADKAGSARSSGPGPAIFKLPIIDKNLGGTYFNSGNNSHDMILTSAVGEKISVRLERNQGGFWFNDLSADGKNIQVQPELLHILLMGEDRIDILFGAEHRD